MTLYIVIPAEQEVALRAAYEGLAVPAPDAGEGEIEHIGAMQVEGNGARKIAGTSRLTPERAIELEAAGVTGLVVVDAWPEGWVWPEEGE